MNAQRRSVNAALLALRSSASFVIFFVALLALTLRAAAAEPASSTAVPTVIVVTGAAGEEEFGKHFATWADAWRKAAQLGGARLVNIGPTNAPGVTDRERDRKSVV